MRVILLLMMMIDDGDDEEEDVSSFDDPQSNKEGVELLMDAINKSGYADKVSIAPA